VSLNTTPRTWVAGEVVTAAELNTEVRDAFTNLQANWTSYTSTLTAATTNPTGQTYSSAWTRVGTTISVRIQITMAATTGTGAYSVALPATPKASVEQSIHGLILDSGVGNYRDAMRFVGSATATLLVDPTTAGAIMRAASPTVPITFGANDVIAANGVYESV